MFGMQAVIVFVFGTSSDHDQHANACSLIMACTVHFSATYCTITTPINDE